MADITATPGEGIFEVHGHGTTTGSSFVRIAGITMTASERVARIKGEAIDDQGNRWQVWAVGEVDPETSEFHLLSSSEDSSRIQITSNITTASNRIELSVAGLSGSGSETFWRGWLQADVRYL